MGCDGYLYKLDDIQIFRLICYRCGLIVDLSHPRKGHESCVDDWNGEEMLRVDIDCPELELR